MDSYTAAMKVVSSVSGFRHDSPSVNTAVEYFIDVIDTFLTCYFPVEELFLHSLIPNRFTPGNI